MLRSRSHRPNEITQRRPRAPRSMRATDLEAVRGGAVAYGGSVESWDSWQSRGATQVAPSQTAVKVS